MPRLAFYERHRYVLNAIERETETRKWGRHKKITLIATTSPVGRSKTAPTVAFFRDVLIYGGLVIPKDPDGVGGLRDL